MEGRALLDSAACQTGRAWIEAGYFWEAHEVLEAVWLAARPNSLARGFVRAAIQLANAGLKQRMQRPGAVGRLLAQAASSLAELRAGGSGMLTAQEIAWLAEQIERLRKNA